MPLKNLTLTSLSGMGVLAGFCWGMMNLGIDFLFWPQELEGTFLTLFFSFITAGALFGVFILFLALWMGHPLDRRPYGTAVRVSLLVWFVYVVLGGVMSQVKPERYHFNLNETMIGGIKVFLLGIMLGWCVKNLTKKTEIDNKTG
ncbi:MAG: hypothetical protein ACYDBV_02760 [Nitrospiria bacterium]